MTPRRTAILAGATGLVGGHCLDAILSERSYGRVVCLLRRRLPREHPKMEQRVVDFDHLEETAGDLRGDHLFCCLGTTLRDAGSREAFRKADLDLPMSLARAAASAGAKRFILVSSLGADPASRVFYLRVKGELETAASRLPFEAVHIMRPSLLLGRGSGARPLERVAASLLTMFPDKAGTPMGRLRPVEAKAVAQAMVRAALHGPAGVHVCGSDVIRLMAGG